MPKARLLFTEWCRNTDWERQMYRQWSHVKIVNSVIFGRIRKVLRNTLTRNLNIVVQSIMKEVQGQWKSPG